jgi:flagellar hook protein FlgE
MYAECANGGGANNIGIGVTLAAVAQQFTQGNISSTDNPMDLALNGAGFPGGLAGGVEYLRNGQFQVDPTAMSSTCSSNG